MIKRAIGFVLAAALLLQAPGFDFYRAMAATRRGSETLSRSLSGHLDRLEGSGAPVDWAGLLADIPQDDGLWLVAASVVHRDDPAFQESVEGVLGGETAVRLRKFAAAVPAASRDELVGLAGGSLPTLARRSPALRTLIELASAARPDPAVLEASMAFSLDLRRPAPEPAPAPLAVESRPIPVTHWLAAPGRDLAATLSYMFGSFSFKGGFKYTPPHSLIFAGAVFNVLFGFTVSDMLQRVILPSFVPHVALPATIIGVPLAVALIGTGAGLLLAGQLLRPRAKRAGNILERLGLDFSGNAKRVYSIQSLNGFMTQLVDNLWNMMQNFLFAFLGYDPSSVGSLRNYYHYGVMGTRISTGVVSDRLPMKATFLFAGALAVTFFAGIPALLYFGLLNYWWIATLTFLNAIAAIVSGAAIQNRLENAVAGKKDPVRAWGTASITNWRNVGTLLGIVFAILIINPATVNGETVKQMFLYMLYAYVAVRYLALYLFWRFVHIPKPGEAASEAPGASEPPSPPDHSPLARAAGVLRLSGMAAATGGVFLWAGVSFPVFALGLALIVAWYIGPQIGQSIGRRLLERGFQGVSEEDVLRKVRLLAWAPMPIAAVLAAGSLLTWTMGIALPVWVYAAMLSTGIIGLYMLYQVVGAMIVPTLMQDSVVVPDGDQGKANSAIQIWRILGMVFSNLALVAFLPKVLTLEALLASPGLVATMVLGPLALTLYTAYAFPRLGRLSFWIRKVQEDRKAKMADARKALETVSTPVLAAQLAHVTAQSDSEFFGPARFAEVAPLVDARGGPRYATEHGQNPPLLTTFPEGGEGVMNLLRTPATDPDHGEERMKLVYNVVASFIMEKMGAPTKRYGLAKTIVGGKPYLGVVSPYLRLTNLEERPDLAYRIANPTEFTVGSVVDGGLIGTPDRVARKRGLWFDAESNKAVFGGYDKSWEWDSRVLGMPKVQAYMFLRHAKRPVIDKTVAKIAALSDAQLRAWVDEALAEAGIFNGALQEYLSNVLIYNRDGMIRSGVFDAILPGDEWRLKLSANEVAVLAEAVLQGERRADPQRVDELTASALEGLAYVQKDHPDLREPLSILLKKLVRLYLTGKNEAVELPPKDLDLLPAITAFIRAKAGQDAAMRVGFGRQPADQGAFTPPPSRFRWLEWLSRWRRKAVASKAAAALAAGLAVSPAALAAVRQSLVDRREDIAARSAVYETPEFHSRLPLVRPVLEEGKTQRVSERGMSWPIKTFDPERGAEVFKPPLRREPGDPMIDYDRMNPFYEVATSYIMWKMGVPALRYSLARAAINGKEVVGVVSPAVDGLKMAVGVDAGLADRIVNPDAFLRGSVVDAWLGDADRMQNPGNLWGLEKNGGFEILFGDFDGGIRLRSTLFGIPKVPLPFFTNYAKGREKVIEETIAEIASLSDAAIRRYVDEAIPEAEAPVREYVADVLIFNRYAVTRPDAFKGVLPGNKLKLFFDKEKVKVLAETALAHRRVPRDPLTREILIDEVLAATTIAPYLARRKDQDAASVKALFKKLIESHLAGDKPFEWDDASILPTLRYFIGTSVKPREQMRTFGEHK